jgi:hypothetical protein
MRDEVIRAVEAHLKGLGARDISASPFHEDVKFEGPIGPPIKGAPSVRAVFHRIFPNDKGHQYQSAHSRWRVVCHNL